MEGDDRNGYDLHFPSLFELEDLLCNIALVGVQPGVSTAKALAELVRLTEDVEDEFTARRLLKQAPKGVKVRESNLEAFKEIFQTQEFFHHEFHAVDKTGAMRTYWITVSIPEDPMLDDYSKLAESLLVSDYYEVLKGGCLALATDVVITFDRIP